MAAGSGMMNLKTLTWDEKILAQIGLDQAQLRQLLINNLLWVKLFQNIVLNWV